MIWYCVTHSLRDGVRLEPWTVQKETEKCLITVFPRGGIYRQKKNSATHKFFCSFENAQKFALKMAAQFVNEQKKILSSHIDIYQLLLNSNEGDFVNRFDFGRIKCLQKKSTNWKR